MVQNITQEGNFMKEVRSKWIKNVYYHFVIWFVTFALLFIAGVEIGRANNESTILYLVTSRSSTSYFPEYGISMEQGTQTMIRLVPETGNAEVVDSNYSPSYSKSTIRPYTVDEAFDTLNMLLSMRGYWLTEQRGRFLQPDSGREIADDMMNTSSDMTVVEINPHPNV